MLKLIVGIAVAVLLLRYWGDLTGYLDGMVRGEKPAAAAAKAEPLPPGKAPGKKPETIYDRLEKMDK